ncbi:MAG TPA: hypothetical protein IAC67_03880 [Candidatus Coproplasma excrementipullorum]|nr:hypothetical protein [Candidatus Coproplasma excrementipullorum]
MSDEELIDLATVRITEEQKQAIDDLVVACKNIIVDMTPVFNELFETVKAIAQSISDFANEIKSYPDKRVVYLCFYAKKERTRNKNINRVLRWSRQQKKRKEADRWTSTKI